MEKVRYMISDAATLAGVESHVLRYWEDELDLNIPRNEMGHRYYTRENIQEFQRIKDLKEQGYQLKAIRMILHNGNVEEYQGMVQAEAKQIYSGQERDSRNEKVTPPPEQQVVQMPVAPPLQPPLQPPTAQQPPLQPPTLQQSTAQQPTMQQSAAQQPTLQPPTPQQPAAPKVPPQETMTPEERMAQFRELMSNIVGRAISANNEELSLAIGQEVKEQILKEMDYLVREQEEAAEERYKRLDAAIRGNIRRRKTLFQKSEKSSKGKKKKDKDSANPAVQGA